MVRRLAPILAATVAVAGCGSAARQQASSGGGSQAHLSSVDKRSINAGIKRFDGAAASKDALTASMRATVLAAHMTSMSFRYAGAIADELRSASSAWVDLSTAIGTGRESRVNAAERAVSLADRRLKH